jgi:hypothetical protein
LFTNTIETDVDTLNVHAATLYTRFLSATVITVCELALLGRTDSNKASLEVKNRAFQGE